MSEKKFTHIWNEHIRKRPAMYVGSLRLNGILQMLEYLFEEMLVRDEKQPVFDIEFYPENRFTIKATNINLDEFEAQLNNLESQEVENRKLGLPAIISLASQINIKVNHSPRLMVLSAIKGNCTLTSGIAQTEEKYALIDFKADEEIFKELKFDYHQYNIFLRYFATLNQNLKIISSDKTQSEFQRNVFIYPNGIFNMLDEVILRQRYSSGVPYMRLDIEAQSECFVYKIGIAYAQLWSKDNYIKTFAGNIETFCGGSLEHGIMEGLILAVRTAAQKRKSKIVINKKQLMKSLIIIAVVNGEDLEFEGSTKTKLGMPLVQREVKNLVNEKLTEYFINNPKAADYVLAKFFD